MDERHLAASDYAEMDEALDALELSATNLAMALGLPWRSAERRAEVPGRTEGDGSNRV